MEDQTGICLLSFGYELHVSSAKPHEDWQPPGSSLCFFPLNLPFNSLMVHWVPAVLHNTPDFDISFQTVTLQSCLSIKSTCGLHPAINWMKPIGGIFFLPPSLLPPSFPSFFLKNALYYLLALQAFSKFATPILPLSF